MRVFRDKTCHAMTFVGTFAAPASASLAVVVVVPFELCGADFADFGTHSADFTLEMRLAAHKRPCCSTKLRTVGVQPDALDQMHRVGVATARFSAILALGRAANARFDAGLISLVNHGRPLLHFHTVLLKVLNHHDRGDAEALVAAVTARVGTAIIISTFVPLAFLKAKFTNLSTDSANLARKLRLATHELDGGTTHASAVRGQPNTIGQACGTWFETAVVGTALTLTSAADAGINAGIKFGADHGGFPP